MALDQILIMANIVEGGIIGRQAVSLTEFEIGDWDMDATETVAVPHGIQISKIRSIAAVIRTDSGNAIHPVAPSGHTLTFTGDQAWITLANALDVQLGRKTGGDYDNAIFDLTPYNRGWVTVEYEA
jgi:hypothetical protein